MIKRLLIAFLIGMTALSAHAASVFEAGVSYDSDMAPVKTVKPTIPNLETGFFDLYYAADFKPLDILSSDEAVIRKVKTSVLISPINSLIATPSVYNVSVSTGKATPHASNKKDSLMMKLQKNPEDENLLLAYALRLKNSKDYKRAVDVVDAILERNPDNALAHFLKGDILRLKNKLKESVNEYLYAVELNPYLSDAYYNIAKILEILDDKKLAMDYYKMAYKVNPNDLEVKNIILKNYVEL